MFEAVLIAPDGEYVTDYVRDCVGAVQDELADQGSRWFFYPYEFVVRANDNVPVTQRDIISASFPYDYLQGASIAAAIEEIRNANS